MVLSMHKLGPKRFPQGSTGPQGSLGIPRNLGFFCIFWDFWGIFWIFGQILRFLVKIMWFLSFSSKNDAESLWNFVKIPFLDPKRAKLDQKFWFGHVRTCPGGPIWAPYGPTWAHMGPNPDWAPSRARCGLHAKVHVLLFLHCFDAVELTDEANNMHNDHEIIPESH